MHKNLTLSKNIIIILRLFMPSIQHNSSTPLFIAHLYTCINTYIFSAGVRTGVWMATSEWHETRTTCVESQLPPCTLCLDETLIYCIIFYICINNYIWEKVGNKIMCEVYIDVNYIRPLIQHVDQGVAIRVS